MINYDDVIKENIKDHNPSCSQTLHHPHRILIIGGSGSGKTNALLTLIKNRMMITVILLVKFIYKLRIHMMQNINISLKEVKRNGFEILEASKGLYQISLFFINIFRNLYVRIFIN